jgi:flagellar hook assembly protein FlgD
MRSTASSSTATIRYHLDGPGPVRLEVFDAGGRRITTLADGVQSAGSHRVSWDGTDYRGREVASGVYYYRLRQKGNVCGRDVDEGG